MYKQSAAILQKRVKIINRLWHDLSPQNGRSYEHYEKAIHKASRDLIKLLVKDVLQNTGHRL